MITYQLERVENTTADMAALVCKTTVWIGGEHMHRALARANRHPAAIRSRLDDFDVTRGATTTKVVDRERPAIL